LSCRNITLNPDYFPTFEKSVIRITTRTYSKYPFSRRPRSRFDQADLIGVTNIACAAKGASLEVTTVWVQEPSGSGTKSIDNTPVPRSIR
jgi:hypothetical protein